jgi:putative ABC transport system permease protein
MIALAFGGIGILAGMGVTGILGLTGIESSNQILQIFMGGPVLNPTVSGSSVLLSLLGVVAAGLLASLYPASIALGIRPVVAMNQN